MSERDYCSLRNPDETLAGTAPHADVWLLLEYRPAWKARAHQDNELSCEVRGWLDDAISLLSEAGFRPKLQFIRQPEIDQVDTRLFIGVADRLLSFSGTGYDFLSQLDLLQVVRRPELYPALVEPRYFVCTNGQRDVCCARFGLRSYAALREQVGDRVWQITHLGGHRFAPNLLVFPQAAMYGRVSEDDVPEFVGIIEAGDWDFARLRGRCRYPGHVQAAEITAARSDLKLLHVAGDEQTAQITLNAGEDTVKIQVQRSSRAIATVKSCGAEAEAVFPYNCQLL